MPKMILTFVLFLSLTGCVPAAFVAGAGAGAVMYNKRDVGTMIADNDASNAVRKAIDRDVELYQNTNISVSTVNGVMLLVGQALTPQDRNKVYQIASQVPKVKRIYNEVTIEPPTPLSVRSNDSWITTKVKSALLAEKGLQSKDVKVVTENSVVYLMGIVTPKQATLAANAASKVKRVRKVVKVFEYQQ